MAVFKIYKGKSENFSPINPPFKDGSAYLTTDDGGFYIDATFIDPQTSQSVNRRIKVNSWEDVQIGGISTAPTLEKEVEGKTLVDLDDKSTKIATSRWFNTLIRTTAEPKDGNVMNLDFGEDSVSDNIAIIEDCDITGTTIII